MSKLPKKHAFIYAVEDNFLESVYLDYYKPTEINENVEFKTLENGQIDVISGLYSKNSIFSSFNFSNFTEFTKIDVFSNADYLHFPKYL